jgi:hypothetical protein
MEMNFGQAIELAKQGKEVAREGWNGKGMFIFLFSKSDFMINCTEEQFEDHLIDEADSKIDHLGFNVNGHFLKIEDFLLLKTAGGTCIPWNASQQDTIAGDWQLVSVPQKATSV